MHVGNLCYAVSVEGIRQIVDRYVDFLYLYVEPRDECSPYYHDK